MESRVHPLWWHTRKCVISVAAHVLVMCPAGTVGLSLSSPPSSRLSVLSVAIWARQRFWPRASTPTGLYTRQHPTLLL